MAVVGVKEADIGKLALRSPLIGDLGSFAVDDLLDHLSNCIENAEEMKIVGDKEEASDPDD